MTVAEALAQAEAEGLTLARSDKPSGFRSVTMRPNNKARLYVGKVWRDSTRPPTSDA